MEIFERNKKIILLIGIFAIVLIIYLVFFTGGSSKNENAVLDPTTGGLVSNSTESPSDAIVGHELITMLVALKAVSLDTSFFTDSVFMSLKDWSQLIDMQPFGKDLGRRNPFSDFARAILIAPPSKTAKTTTAPSSAFGSGKPPITQ